MMFRHPLRFLRIQGSRLAPDSNQEDFVLIGLSKSQAVSMLSCGCAPDPEPGDSGAQEQSEHQEQLFHGSSLTTSARNVVAMRDGATPAAEKRAVPLTRIFSDRSIHPVISWRSVGNELHHATLPRARTLHLQWRASGPAP